MKTLLSLAAMLAVLACATTPPITAQIDEGTYTGNGTMHPGECTAEVLFDGNIVVTYDDGSYDLGWVSEESTLIFTNGEWMWKYSYTWTAYDSEGESMGWGDSHILQDFGSTTKIEIYGSDGAGLEKEPDF